MRLILAALALVAGVGGAWAQQNDPYADAVKEEKLRRYLDFRAHYLKEVEYLAWSYGCLVIQNEAAIPSLLNEFAIGSDETVIDNHIADLRSAAYRRGIEKSKGSGGCDYWKDHPEEVTTLRQRAINSIR